MSRSFNVYIRLSKYPLKIMPSRIKVGFWHKWHHINNHCWIAYNQPTVCLSWHTILDLVRTLTTPANWEQGGTSKEGEEVKVLRPCPYHSGQPPALRGTASWEGGSRDPSSSQADVCWVEEGAGKCERAQAEPRKQGRPNCITWIQMKNWWVIFTGRDFF